MSTFLLLPGAGGTGKYWSRVAALLDAAGHEAVVVDFPGADEKAGLDAYADIAVRAVDGKKGVVLVAQSMAGFTAPLVAQRVAVTSIVFVNAMIPIPGETASEWGEHVRSQDARAAAAKAGGYSEAFEIPTYFLHDLSPEVAREVMEKEAPEAPIAFQMPCAFEAWPAVPMHLVIGADDRLFPADFQERVARERLGDALTSVVRVPGGHLVALAHPAHLAATLTET